MKRQELTKSPKPSRYRCPRIIMEIYTQRERDTFLKHLLETVKEERRVVSMFEIGEAIGFTEQKTKLIVQYLEGEGLVEQPGREGVRLTHPGLKVAADLLSEPEQPMQYSPQAVPAPVRKGTAMWDIFICHAGEDKDAVARPLANGLTQAGLKVWYDEFTLTLGDSLRHAIDCGLAGSRYGAVILSPDFFAKEWPQRELDGLTAREIDGEKVILPIWHKVTHKYITRFSPTLADRLGASTDKGLDTVVREILRVVRPGAASESVGYVPKHETNLEGSPLPETERQPGLTFKVEEIGVRYAGGQGGTNSTLYTQILVINRGQRDRSLLRLQVSEEGGPDWQLTEEPFSPDGTKLKLPIKVPRDDALFFCIRAQSSLAFEERMSSQVGRLKLKAQDHLDEQHELWLTEGPTSVEPFQEQFGLKPTPSQVSETEIKWVDPNYPSDSGLQPQLETQGYKVRWCRDDFLARRLDIEGWELVEQELGDGRRVNFKIKDRPYDQTLIKKREPC